VDVDQRSVEVHRGPGARGYQDVRAPGPADDFSPLAFPDLTVTLADLLG
jgi:Uma2 family endonuclease